LIGHTADVAVVKEECEVLAGDNGGLNG